MTLYNDMNISPVLGTNLDDVITGTGRSEVLSGAGGDDTIQALSGNDEVFGGTGNDTLYGQGGDDTMYGNGKPKFVDMSDFEIAQSTTAKVTFMDEGAGFRNALGVYEIGEDGSFSNVKILFPNASKLGSGGELIPGQSNVEFDVSAGAKLGFFVVSNGYGKGTLNQEALSAETGHFELRNSDSQPGSLADSSVELFHVDPSTGEEVAIKSQYGYSIFHSIGTSENNYSPNPDQYNHVVGRANAVSGEMLIGFEDLYGGGDKDYDDTVISVQLGQENIVSLLPKSTGSGGVKPDDDILYGGDGHDTMYGIGGDDYLAGGEGNDELNGNSGNDTLNGNNGNDVLNGQSGNDTLSGGNGNDVLSGNSGDDHLSGNNGDDKLYGGSGVDELYGGNGNDILEGGSGDNTLSGGNGSDTLIGGSSVDIMDGGSGNDILKGGSGDDIMKGGSGADTLQGNSGDDEMHGGYGADTLEGHSGDDAIYGDSSGDRLVGGGGNDYLDGGKHNDKLYGGSNDDTLIGGHGNDYMNGGSGADMLEGGLGKDKLIGGSGADQFIFKDLGGSMGQDTIYDFSIAEDTMLFSGFGIENFQDFLGVSTQEDDNVVVDLGGNDCVNIKNCTLNTFTEDMFFFA